MCIKLCFTNSGIVYVWKGAISPTPKEWFNPYIYGDYHPSSETMG